MRRTRLVWLAIGIVVGLVAATLPAMLSASDADNVAYVRLDGDELDPKSDSSAMKAVWACGGRDFVTTLTHSVGVAIPIEHKNFKTIDCAIKAASGTNITVTISDKEF